MTATTTKPPKPKRSKKTVGIAGAVVGGLAIISTLLVVNATNNSKAFGNFESKCAFDHMAPDDPIVRPGEPGASHHHIFFGAVGVDAFTKPADNLGGPTTCENPLATGAYWFPSLIDKNGKHIEPVSVTAAYTAGGKDRTTVVPFPAGLVMVGGSLVPPASPIGSVQTDWTCNPGGQPYSQNATFVQCENPGKQATVVRLPMPDCEAENPDGTPMLDSPDHRSHMVYSERPKGAKGTSFEVCPTDHPIPVPQVSLRVFFPKGVIGPVTLSSGPTQTWHADFMNSWDQDELSRLVQTCIVEQKQCSQT